MSILVQNIDVVHKMVEAVTIKFRLYYKQKEIETIFPRPQTVSVAAVGREGGGTRKSYNLFIMEQLEHIQLSNLYILYHR